MPFCIWLDISTVKKHSRRNVLGSLLLQTPQFHSKIIGDYQIITVHHSHSNYLTGGSDETMSFTMKIDTDLNAEGSFSINRKSWATAGMGMGAIGSTCNMSMSGSFGPDQPDKTYWGGYGLLIYNKAPQSFSFSVGGFTAYFEPDNHLDTFNYSTSSTNAECYVLIK